jgi:acetyl-CoA carboxylase biotin carboxyl carrier protein
MDIKKIERLAELMNQHGLTELEICEKDTKVRLARGTVAVAPAPVAAAPAPQEEKAAPEKNEGAQPLYITAPMPGTFYSSSSPDSMAFVTVGDRVKPNTTVCIVEAMKVMNEVKAEVSGVITRILAVSGAPVEYGQRLFEVSPLSGE